MITRRRDRTLAALLAVGALLVTACGTRLDHASIVRAGAAGTGGQALPGAEGLPGDALPGGADGALDGAGESGGADGTNGGPGGAAGSGPGAGRGSSGGSGGDGGPSGGPPIVIGTAGTYSGPAGVAYAQGARALQAWAAAANAKGGLNGRQVKVIVSDDGGDPAKARSQVQELVEQHNVVAIVASMVNNETLVSWKGYVEEKKVPVIGGSCGFGWWDSPMLFAQCTNSDALIYGTAVVGAKHGAGKKFGALICQETSSCSNTENVWFAKGAAKRAGLDPVYRARISLTQPDYTSECIQARNAGVQLFSVVGDPNSVARVASSCRRQNFRPQFLQISATADAATASKPGLENVLAAMQTFPFAGLSTPGFTEFGAAWQRYGGGKAAGPSASLGWASAKLFEKAVRSAGKSVTRDGLVKALRSLRNERLGGLTVPLSFGTGSSKNSECVFFMKASGGKWTAPSGDRPVCF